MKVIDYKKLNETSMIFIFDNNEQRVFCIDRMFQDDIPQGQQYRWKTMFNKGLFYSSFYLSCGEPTWGGWVELIENEPIIYTTPYKE